MFFKKIFAAAAMIAAILPFAVPTTAFASSDTTYSIKIQSTTEGHEYCAYQIFSGDYENGVLTNIEWGSGVAGDELLSALQSDSTFEENGVNAFAGCTTADKTASVLTAFDDDSTLVSGFAKTAAKHLSTVSGSTDTLSTSAYVINNLSAGYYLVKDTSSSLTGNDSYSSFIVKIVADVTMTPKSYLPVIEKKIYESSYQGSDEETEKYGSGYNDVADCGIGDIVYFKVICSLPQNFSDYDSYYLKIVDKVSDAYTLAYTDDDSDVKAEFTNGSDTIDLSSYCTCTGTITDTTEAVKKVYFTCNDLKSVLSAVTVNSDSKITITYSAKLNEDAVIGSDGNGGRVYATFSNDPNDSSKSKRGTTLTDYVTAYSYQLDVISVASSDSSELLGNAGFKLYKKVSGTKYYAVVTNDKISDWTTAESSASTLLSDTDGKISFTGLDEGTYYLSPTAAPPGYNKLKDDIEVVISADTENSQSWTSDSTALTALTAAAGGKQGSGDAQTGIAEVKIAFAQGSKLPETGGIGATVYYVSGSTLICLSIFGLARLRRKEKKASQK